MERGLLSLSNYDSWKPRRQFYDPAFKKRQVNLWSTFYPCNENEVELVGQIE